MSAQLTALLAAILWLQAMAVPTGDHTCTGVVKHPVNVLVNVTEPVTFRSYTWCLRVPPRCSKYTVQLKDRVKLHVEMHNKTITVCCEGYVEMEGKCVPACPPGADCPFMRCNRTNHCHCTPGYTGLYCNEACPRGLWGKDCKRPCDCPSGYTCHHLTGDCFVDDRPPRRTTPPTTTTTTTTTRTTTITTSTTEGTTLETVKTPVFRFPPPPWVESAADSKKTTTRQIKKDESPPTKEMDIIEQIFDVTTKKTLLEISLPTLATAQIINKTSVERPPIIELFPPIFKEGEITKKDTDDRKYFKKIETREKIPVNTISTISSNSTEKDESQTTDENLINKDHTFSKETTTPIPTTKTTEFPNNLKLHTVTTQTPMPISFTDNHQHNSEKSSTIMVHTTATVPTKLPDILEQKPTITSEPTTTKDIFYKTKPVESTYENEIQTQTFATSVTKHTTGGTEKTAIDENLFTMEPKSTVIPRFFLPSNESLSGTDPTTEPEENINSKETSVKNKDQPTTPPFKYQPTTNPVVEKHITSTFSDPETLQETIVFKTQNTPAHSTLSNNIPVTLLTGFSMTPLSYTSNVLISSSSSIENHENISINQVHKTSTESTTSNNIISKRSDIPHFPIVNLTKAAITTPKLLTTTITFTTTVSPPTIKSAISSTPTTKETPTITAKYKSSTIANLIKTPSTIATTRIPVRKMTPPTVPTIYTPMTIAITSIPQSTPVSPLKNDSSSTAVKSMASSFPASKEISEEEINFHTTKPQLEEKESTTVPILTLATDVAKDFNTNKKIKSDEGHIIYSGQDKSKKKHEKIKPKNVNAKEFSSIHQTKIEKQNETMMQQTTKITLRSILQAETFINKIETTKSPRPTKIEPPPPPPDFMNINYVTDDRPVIETVSHAPTPSKPNQIWYELKKQNFSNIRSKELEQPLGVLKEPPEISESSPVTTEINRVMESNTIDYRQSSEEPIKKMLAQDEETNYSLIFNKIKFNMTESVAAGVKLSREEKSYFHLPMILVLGIALVTLLLLTLTLWVYLKRRRQQAEPFPPCIMAYAMEETPPMECDSYDQAFFCPTFTNTYAEKINRELRELNYDHPRSSHTEPLYAEIFS